MDSWSSAKKKYLGKIKVLYSCSSNSYKLGLVVLQKLNHPHTRPQKSHSGAMGLPIEMFYCWSILELVYMCFLQGKKNRIGWYSRPFQVYIYIINKLYWSQDGISKSLVVTIYFSWQGRESDFLVETAKFVEMDPIMKQKSSREINNKKKSFHTSQTLLLKFKYQILE